MAAAGHKPPFADDLFQVTHIRSGATAAASARATTGKKSTMGPSVLKGSAPHSGGE